MAREQIVCIQLNVLSFDWLLLAGKYLGCYAAGGHLIGSDTSINLLRVCRERISLVRQCLCSRQTTPAHVHSSVRTRRRPLVSTANKYIANAPACTDYHGQQTIEVRVMQTRVCIAYKCVTLGPNLRLGQISMFSR